MSKLVSVVIGIGEEAEINKIAELLEKDYEADICEINQTYSCIFAGIKEEYLRKIKQLEGVLAIVKEEPANVG